MFVDSFVQLSYTKVVATVKEPIFVVRGLWKALIGHPALQLICRVNTVDSIKQEVL